MKWFEFEADIYMGVAEVKLSRSAPPQSSLVFITNPFDPAYAQNKKTLKEMGYRVVNEGLLWVPTAPAQALTLPLEKVTANFKGKEVDWDFETIRQDTAVQFQRFKNNLLHDLRSRAPVSTQPDFFTENSNPAEASPVTASETASGTSASPAASSDEQEPPVGVAPVKVGANQFIYEPFSQIKRAYLSQPAGVASTSHVVLRDIQDIYQMSVDDFVCQQLRYSKEELARYFFAEQVDSLALAIHSYMQGNGFLNGDGTGSGKSYVLAGMLRFLHIQNQPVLFLTESAEWYDRFFTLLQETGNEALVEECLLLNNNRVFKLADGTPVGQHNGKAPPSFDFLTRNPDPYSVFETYPVVFGTYALFNKTLPDLRLAEIKEQAVQNKQEIESLLLALKDDSLDERDLSIARRKTLGHLASYAYNPLSGKDVYEAERKKWQAQIAPATDGQLFDFSPEVAKAFDLMVDVDFYNGGRKFSLLEGQDYFVENGVFRFKSPLPETSFAIVALATLDDEPLSGYEERVSLSHSSFQPNNGKWQFRWKGYIGRAGIDLGTAPAALPVNYLSQLKPTEPFCARATSEKGQVRSLFPRQGLDTIPLFLKNHTAETLKNEPEPVQSGVLRKIEQHVSKMHAQEKRTVTGFGVFIGLLQRGSKKIQERFKNLPDLLSFAPIDETGQRFAFSIFESEESFNAIRQNLGEAHYDKVYTQWAQSHPQDAPFLEKEFVGTLEQTRACLGLHQALAEYFIGYLLNTTLQQYDAATSVSAPVIPYPFMQSKEQIEMLSKLPSTFQVNLEHILYASKKGKRHAWGRSPMPEKTMENVGMVLFLAKQYYDHIAQLRHLAQMPILQQHDLLKDLAKGALVQPIEVRFSEAQNKLTWLYRLTREEKQTPRLAILADETHNVTNNNNAQTARNLLPLMSQSKFTGYATATTGKRFSGVLNYAALLKDANLPLLSRILKKGGLRAQENLFLSMVQKGVLCRREQNIGNYTYQVLNAEPYIEQSKATIDQIAPLLSKLNEIGRVLLKERDESKNNFAGRLHLFSRILNAVFNAEQCADEVLASLKRGEKPIVTVDITMDSAILSLFQQEKDRLYPIEEEQDLSDDSDIEAELLNKEASSAEVNFIERSLKETEHGFELHNRIGIAALLKRSLDSMLTQDGKPIALSLSSEILIKEFTEDLARLPHVPLSYLDVVRQKIEAAGDFKVAELSRRRFAVNTVEDKDYIKVLPKVDKNQVVDDFNAGKIDVLMMSRVGSENISLHACKDFEDQRQRNLIELQPADDVLKRVQFWGRVGRSNSVVDPKISFCFSGLPFEQRLQAMQTHNLLQLGANTSGSVNTYKVGIETESYLSPLGECAALNLLLTQSGLADRLGFSTNALKFRADRYGLQSDATLPSLEKVSATLTIRQLIGRACLLSVAEQEQIFADLNTRIKSLREAYEDIGVSFSESKVLDFKATEIRRIPQPLLSIQENDQPLEVVTYEYTQPLAFTNATEFLNLLLEGVRTLATESSQTYSLDRGSIYAESEAIAMRLIRWGMCVSNSQLKSFTDDTTKDLHARSVLLLSQLRRSFFTKELGFGSVVEDFKHNAYVYLGSSTASFHQRVFAAFDSQWTKFLQTKPDDYRPTVHEEVEVFLEALQQNLPKAYLLNIYTGEVETHLAHKFQISECHNKFGVGLLLRPLAVKIRQKQDYEFSSEELDKPLLGLTSIIEGGAFHQRRFQVLEGNDLLAVEIASQVPFSMPSIFTTDTGKTIQATVFPSGLAKTYRSKVAQLLGIEDLVFTNKHLPALLKTAKKIDLKVGLDSQQAALSLTFEAQQGVLQLRPEANSVLKATFNHIISSAKFAPLSEHSVHRRSGGTDRVVFPAHGFNTAFEAFHAGCTEHGLNITVGLAAYHAIMNLKKQTEALLSQQETPETNATVSKNDRLRALAQQLATSVPVTRSAAADDIFETSAPQKRIPSYEEMTHPDLTIKHPTVKL